MTNHEALSIRWLRPEEVRTFQWRNKKDAVSYAARQSRETGIKHQAFLTHTWRNLEPCICWTTCIALKWQKGRLQTWIK